MSVIGYVGIEVILLNLKVGLSASALADKWITNRKNALLFLRQTHLLDISLRVLCFSVLGNGRMNIEDYSNPDKAELQILLILD